MKIRMRSVLGAAVPMMVAGAMLLPGSGCDKIEEAQGAVCCNEFQVGGAISADIAGSAQAQVAVQAVADIAGVASVMVTDMTTACRNIAQDLDAPKADQDAAAAIEDPRESMKAWCSLAVAQIGSFKGNAQLTVKATGPQCEASISAKADCQGKCSVEGECDIKANPPTCEGGSLEVACKGECTAKAGATLKCEGSCTGECSGSCVAEGGVECAGKCDGTCEASAQGNGDGIQADGTCKGVCKGTCEVTAPSASCSGTCKGECSASCTGSAEASVKCDGECSADYEPLKCTGGELKGGCSVDAECDASCDASLKAKAECKPPQVSIEFSGSADAKLNKLKVTLEANLGVVYGIKAKLDVIGQAAASLEGNISGFAEVKAACLIPIGIAAAAAAENIAASGSATVQVVGSIGG